MADILVLTKNQAMLVFKLAAIYGRNIDDKIGILKEIMPVIGSAFLWRTAARTAVGLAPAPIAALPKAAIALRRDVSGRADRALLLRAGRPAAARGATVVPGRGADAVYPASTTASSSRFARGEAAASPAIAPLEDAEQSRLTSVRGTIFCRPSRSRV